MDVDYVSLPSSISSYEDDFSTVIMASTVVDNRLNHNDFDNWRTAREHYVGRGRLYDPLDAGMNARINTRNWIMANRNTAGPLAAVSDEEDIFG